MVTNSFKQTIRFQASVNKIFEMMMDSKVHQFFTQSPASISRKEGGVFSTYDGWCSGRNIEIIEGERIVQAWRSQDWQEGVFSILTMRFTSLSDKSCKLEVTQTAVPGKTQLEKVKKGWDEHYWAPMKAHIKQQLDAGGEKLVTKKPNQSMKSRKTKTGQILRRVA